jgi:hypothetical protein
MDGPEVETVVVEKVVEIVMVLLVWTVGFVWGTHEHLEVLEKLEEREGWWGVARWCRGVRIRQDSTPDAVSRCMAKDGAIISFDDDGRLAECCPQRRMACTNADVFIEDV